jgi:acyl dehydratase
VRHTAPTFEGDMLRYSARITETASRSGGIAISCEVEGKNQQNEQILVGSCLVLLPSEQASV